MPKGVYVRTPETRAAIAKAARDPVRRAKVSKGKTGKPRPDIAGPNGLAMRPGVRAKMSANNAMKRPEIQAKMSALLMGRVMSEDTRAKMAVAKAKHYAKHSGPWAGTWPEQVAAALLENAGVAFEAQRRFGRYVVDFFLPDSRAVVEVDGVFWHGYAEARDPGRGARRDAYLRQQGVTAVHHVTDTQLSVDGWLTTRKDG